MESHMDYQIKCQGNMEETTIDDFNNIRRTKKEVE
jgi:hypothetical protein